MQDPCEGCPYAPRDAMCADTCPIGEALEYYEEACQ